MNISLSVERTKAAIETIDEVQEEQQNKENIKRDSKPVSDGWDNIDYDEASELCSNDEILQKNSGCTATTVHEDEENKDNQQQQRVIPYGVAHE